MNGMVQSLFIIHTVLDERGKNSQESELILFNLSTSQKYEEDKLEQFITLLRQKQSAPPGSTILRNIL